MDESASLSAPGATRSAAGAGSSPLGLSVVTEALGRDGAGATLSAFLAETDPQAALSLWFGDRAACLLSDTDALRGALDRDIAALDLLLGEQVEEILHHAAFQTLEASWRGLAHLLAAVEDDERVLVRVLSIRWDEVCRDLNRAAEFDQSTLFERIYSDEFGMPGGLPYGLIVCDFEARHRRRPGDPFPFDDISALGGLSAIGAAAFAPVVIGGSSDLMGIEDFTDLSFAQDVQMPFRAPEYARWRELQSRSDSRFLAVALPRILLRDRLPDDGGRHDGFRFTEGAGGLSIDDRLWGNAAYALGANVVRAYRNWGWFADIRGSRQDADDAGIVTGLTAPAFSTGEAIAFRRPLEVELTDRKQKQMEEIGLTAVSPCHLSPYGVFLGTPSIHQPGLGGTQVRDANERISSMLQYILCVSRFAHYVKVMARDRVGAYTTAADLENRLNTWLRQYTVGNLDASEEMKARFPLNSAQVSVTEAAGKPGTFACVIQLKPHFQIDQMVATFRLYTELHGLRH